MGIFALFGLVFAAAIALIVGDALWKRWRPPARQYGTQPGQGYVLMHANFSGRGTAARSWHVPRDPQAYAKFFVPSGHNKD